jgi:hypothetical protein
MRTDQRHDVEILRAKVATRLRGFPEISNIYELETR